MEYSLTLATNINYKPELIPPLLRKARSGIPAYAGFR